MSIKRKLVAAIAALTLSASMLPMPAASAGWGDLIGAGIGIAVQYNQVDKELKYYDDEGRFEFFEQLKKEYKVNDDPYLNARLDGIMSNLMNAIAVTDPTVWDKPYNYFVNPSEEFNAFCTLGHNVSVNTGMFNLVSSDDQIAVVVGHEIAHGQKNHSRKGLKDSLNSAILGEIAAAATGSNIIGGLLANNVSAVHMTKPKEWEADNLAFDYIINSNYNPGACAAIWQRVIDQYGAQKSNFVGDIFSPSDHPGHQERRDNYAKKLCEWSGKKVELVADDNALAVTIKVNGKAFMTPLNDSTRSGMERAYYIAGNLAAAYHHTGGKVGRAYASGDTVMLGEQPIVGVVDGEPSAAELARKLAGLL